MKYTEKIEVRWHDTDASRCVRPSEMLVYMQETANRQLENAGLSLDELRDTKRLAFILSKIKIVFHNQLFAYDLIDARTWTCDSKGYTFNRCFDIHKDGKLIAEAVSFWALVDIDEKKLVRSDDFSLGVEPDEMLEISVSRRIKPPNEEITVLGQRDIRYSDIDYNMHMNNTRYPNLLCDFMPIDQIPKIREITLEFLHESAFGNTLTIYGASKDGRYYFKAINENNDTCLVAEVIVEN